MQTISPKIKNRFKLWNPLPYVKSFFQSEIREEILKEIDLRLLYFDRCLINLENQQFIEVELEPVAIAQAAKNLIAQSRLSMGKKKKVNKSSIALFLPLTNFIYTQYSLQGIDAKTAHAALNYQQDEFLPTSSNQLQLTVKHLKQEHNFAIWFSQQKSEDFYQAFKQQILTLSSILPSFSLLSTKNDSTIRESCASYLAQYSFSEHALVSIGHIQKQDMETDNFTKEWETRFGKIENSTHTLHTKTKWFDHLADNRISPNYTQTQYAYFPKEVEKQFKSRGHLRNSRVIGLIAFISIFILAIPFIENERKHSKEEQKYQKYYNLANDVLNKRSTVLSNEDEWGVYMDYPQVDVITIITRLNKIIPVDSWISSFQIKNGYVEVDGYSPNPTAILEIISSQDGFNEVAFNKNTRTERGKNKERFGITFHIKDLNIEEYENKYFSDDR